MRRRALRHGDAGPARRLRADLGHRGPSRSGRRRPQRCASSSRTSASWPRSTGTWNGRSSSRDSTTPTTSGSTTACATGHARPVREHLHAGLDYQDKLARFLENHDEPRAAATFAPGVHRAAAVITYLVTGPAVLPSGAVRRAGRSAFRRISFGRPKNSSDTAIERVLRPAARGPPAARRRERGMAVARPAGRPGTATGPGIHFIACILARIRRRAAAGRRELRRPSEPVLRPACRSPSSTATAGGSRTLLGDPPATTATETNCSSAGLYLDLAPWQYHVFAMTRALEISE